MTESVGRTGSVPPKGEILGYAVDVSTVDEICGGIVEWIQAKSGFRWLACINPHSYAVAHGMPVFAKALRDADWLIPDGVGVVMASNFLKRGVRERVTGSDIFEGVCRRLNELGGKSVYFFGASEATLADIRRKFAVDYPKVRLAGTFSPPFKPEYTAVETEAMIEAINASGADVLWVGMTSPKQDLWIQANRQHLRVSFAAGIGAVFDFYTGRVKRTPAIFRKMGLEWLPRLLQQPRRLWKRMGVSAPLFVAHVLKERVRAPKARA